MGDAVPPLAEEVPERAGLGVETRSIDYIPHRERRGRARDLGAVWFVGNAELVSFATGPIGIVLGLNFAWTAIAILLGTLLGCLLMAFHSAQGPKLGLSQMIQSRAQFGYIGALFPIAVALFIFIGYSVFDTFLGGQLFNETIRTPLKASYVLFAVLALGVTVVGYHLIHRISRWASVLYVVNFGLFTVIALWKIRLPHDQFALTAGTFKVYPFLIVLGALMGYNLTWAPYVSDYSRYLPFNTSTKSTFWWTYLGSGVGSVWPAAIGALVAAAFPTATTTGSIHQVGNLLFQGWGFWALLLLAPTLVLTTTLSMYAASLTTMSAVSVVVPLKQPRRWRITFGLTIAVVIVLLTFLIPSSFYSTYNAFLTICLYFMIPWTAVNLVDFFFVRKGNYAIKDIFSPNGIYGRWGVRGFVAYFVSFAVMVPFFSTSIFTGFISSSIGGADISPFVGFPVAAVLYYLLSRNINVAAEERLGREQMAELELEAAGTAGTQSGVRSA
jgi:nucleobase:cation symporter-1, NCS1 family